MNILIVIYIINDKIYWDFRHFFTKDLIWLKNLVVLVMDQVPNFDFSNFILFYNFKISAKKLFILLVKNFFICNVTMVNGVYFEQKNILYFLVIWISVGFINFVIFGSNSVIFVISNDFIDEKTKSKCREVVFIYLFFKYLLFCYI